MFGVQGVNPLQSQQSSVGKSANQDMASAIKELSQTMKGLTDKVFDSESQMVTKDQAGQKTQEAQAGQTQQAHMKAGKVDELLAQLLAVLGEDEVDKKKKIEKKFDKKTKFEQKIKELADMADGIETEGLDEEQQFQVNEFKNNMNQISNLQGQLNRLNRREAYLEDLLEKQELEKNNKQQKEKQEQGQKEEQENN